MWIICFAWAGQLRVLGVDVRQVYEAIDAGDLPASHVQGRGIRLRPEDVEDYAEAD